MKIAIITAGGAGMFCGSCMQDNTLVRTLRLAGEDAVLVPTYTPIRVDEDDVSIDRVFMGGINVYLDSAIPGWRFLPRWLTGWLNRPAVIRRLAKFGNNTDAAHLGSLTLDMLKGTHGPQKREIDDFVSYLTNEVAPDVIIFSNALLSGVLTKLRPAFAGKIVCLLQGDDIFLDGLTDRWREPVLKQLRNNCQLFDAFLTHSQYYQRHMSEMLQVSPERFHQIPLIVDTQATTPLRHRTLSKNSDDARTIGYFARLCPEKGVQNLLQMAEEVLPAHPNLQIVVAGFLPKQNERWFHDLLHKAQAAAPNRVHWKGSPDGRQEKFELIQSFDLLCVPTDYKEPKGLYVLEAGLVGVPSLLPAHGAFPEIIQRIDSGQLYDPLQSKELANAVRTWAMTPHQPHENLADTIEKQYSMPAAAQTIQKVVSTICQSESIGEQQ